LQLGLSEDEVRRLVDAELLDHHDQSTGVAQ
jgi:hypothetical protein